MKICMVVRAYPPRIGGTGSVVQRISQELSKKGFEITIITQKIKGAPKIEEDGSIKIYRTFNVSDINEFSFLNTGISIIALVRRIAQTKNQDIFHAHDISMAGFSACTAKEFINKPFFLKYGGDLVFEYLSIKKYKNWDPRENLEGTLKYKSGTVSVLHKIQRWYFSNYDLILPDSEYGKNHLINNLHVPSEKVRLLVNGVDDERFAPRGSEYIKRNLGLDGKIIFTAGRLLKWKGMDIIIKSMPEVLKSYPKTKLIIAGEGPEKIELAQLIQNLKLEKNVRLLGNISRNDMPEYLTACDIFVLHSFYDTTPNVLLEALASGKPCIVSDIEGIREVIKNGSALKVPVGNHEKIAEEIVNIFNNESLRKNLSKNSRKTIVERYSWNHVVEDYVKLYENYENLNR